MSWEDDLTPDERSEWDRFVAYQREHTLQGMMKSAFVVSLVPSGDFDIKFAVETGMAIMLDKPILAVVMPGATLPGKFAKVVDRVVYADLDTEEGREAIAAEVAKLAEEGGLK